MDEAKEKKELVRAYMERRRAERRACERSPLHAIEKIRKEMEWDQFERRERVRRKN